MRWRRLDDRRLRRPLGGGDAGDAAEEAADRDGVWCVPSEPWSITFSTSEGR